MYYPITCRAIYNDVRRRMADGRCVRQSTTIQPRTAGLATTYDQADMSSKSASIRLQPSIINEVRTRNKLEANTAIHVVKSIKLDLEQWAVTDLVHEGHQAHKCAKESDIYLFSDEAYWEQQSTRTAAPRGN